jgi:prephenate dehydrogenase
MKLLVVGAGAMGQWFATAVRRGHADPVDVAFADAEHEVAVGAASSTGEGATAVSLDTDERFDVVCIAVPIPAATDAIRSHAARAEDLVVDVTGTATEPVETMREAAPALERLSLHPLFARSNAPGNVAVVADEAGPTGDAIRAALAADGNDLFETTATAHDDAMRTVQARAHVAVLAFALAAEDVPDEFQTPLSAGLFELVAEMTGGDPRVYADIQAAFEGADDVAAAASELAAADPETFAERYSEAAERR